MVMKTAFGTLTTGLLTCITKQLDVITETCDDSDFHYVLIKTKTKVGIEVENLEGKTVCYIYLDKPQGFMSQKQKNLYCLTKICLAKI